MVKPGEKSGEFFVLCLELKELFTSCELLNVPLYFI